MTVLTYNALLLSFFSDLSMASLSPPMDCSVPSNSFIIIFVDSWQMKSLLICLVCVVEQPYKMGSS